MSEVPHCPDCKRADKVKVRSGRGYSYYCNNCDIVIMPDEIVDGPFIDMVKERMFNHPEKVKNKAEFDFSDKCTCEWCEDGRPGIDDISF
jgi:hypothetical protein